MPEFDGISEYVKSGIRRLRDAEELLQPPTLYPKEQGPTPATCAGQFTSQVTGQNSC